MLLYVLISIFPFLITSAENRELKADTKLTIELVKEEREYLIRVRNRNGQMIENAWVSLSLLTENSSDVPLFVEFEHQENGRYYATISGHTLQDKTFELYVYAENYEAYSISFDRLNTDITVVLE